MIKIQYENMAMHTTFSAIIVSSSTKSEVQIGLFSHYSINVNINTKLLVLVSRWTSWKEHVHERYIKLDFLLYTEWGVAPVLTPPTVPGPW